MKVCVSWGCCCCWYQHTLLANRGSTFFINGRQNLINGPRFLPRNPLDCLILDSWVFDNFISFDELLAKAMQILATFLLVNNKIRGKLVLSVLIMSDDTFKLHRLHFLQETLIYLAGNLIT